MLHAVTSGQLGYQFHQHHRVPGTHPWRRFSRAAGEVKGRRRRRAKRACPRRRRGPCDTSVRVGPAWAVRPTLWSPVAPVKLAPSNRRWRQPTAEDRSRSPTTSFFSTGFESKPPPLQVDESFASACLSNIAKHTRADGRVDAPATSVAARTSSISDEPAPSASSKSFNAGKRHPLRQPSLPR